MSQDRPASVRPVFDGMGAVSKLQKPTFLLLWC